MLKLHWSPELPSPSTRAILSRPKMCNPSFYFLCVFIVFDFLILSFFLSFSCFLLSLILTLNFHLGLTYSYFFHSLCSFSLSLRLSHSLCFLSYLLYQFKLRNLTKDQGCLVNFRNHFCILTQPLILFMERMVLQKPFYLHNIYRTFNN